MKEKPQAVTIVDDKKDSFNMKDIMDIVNQSKDSREVAYSFLVGQLSDRDKLNMISRLNGDMMPMIVRNLIVINFFQKYYELTKCKITLKRKSKTTKQWIIADYERDISYVHPFDGGEMKDVYRNIIKDIMELTISIDGKGRSEYIDIIRATDERATMFDKMKSAVGWGK